MSRQHGAELYILGITVVWGSSFTLMKSTLDYIPVFQYLTLRFLIAAILLLLIYCKSLLKVKKRTVIYGAAVGIMIFAGMSLQVAGLQYTTASKSGFITGMNVIMVPVISSIALKKKPPVNTVIGVVLAAAGLFFLSGCMGFSFNKGDLFTLFCAVCFALQIILIDYFVAKEDARLMAVIQMITVTVLCSLVWSLSEPAPFVLTSRAVFTIIFTGVFGTAFAFCGQTIAQQYTTPTRTALILTCEPVFAAIFAILIPDNRGVTESLAQSMLLGGALILSGMIITELFKKNTGKYNTRL